MARHLFHGAQHGQVADAARHKLLLDHGVAAGSLAVGGLPGVVGAWTVAARDGLAAHDDPSR